MRGFCRIFNQKEMFRRLSELSPVAISLYGVILEKCEWRLGNYISTTADIAEEMGVSVRSVQRANNELIKSGLVKVKSGVYTVNPEFSWGGRSWSINNSRYYTMGKKSADATKLVDAAESLGRGRILKQASEKKRLSLNQAT